MKGVFGFEQAIPIIKSGGRVRRLAWPPRYWMMIEQKELRLVTDSVVTKDIVVVAPDGCTQDLCEFCNGCLTLDLLAGDWTTDTHDLPKDTDG